MRKSSQKIVLLNGFSIAFLLTGAPDPVFLNQNQAFWVSQLSSSSKDIRINALMKLADLRSAESLNAITQSLQDSEPEVRNYAIRAMAAIPTAESKEILQAHQKKESDPYLVSETKRSIDKIEEYFKAAASKEAAAQKKKKP